MRSQTLDFGALALAWVLVRLLSRLVCIDMERIEALQRIGEVAGGVRQTAADLLAAGREIVLATAAPPRNGPNPAALEFNSRRAFLLLGGMVGGKVFDRSANRLRHELTGPAVAITKVRH